MNNVESETHSSNNSLSGNQAELNLLLKVQTATKDWDKAPEELIELRRLLIKTGYEVDWSPRKLGVHLLTPNKMRGIALKRVLMKLYPFDAFWSSETLDETLHKCLLVCQQLDLQTERCVIWGQCSMNASHDFWKKVLLKTVSILKKSRNEEEAIHEGKSKVITALIASRGTDWDKQIARNFAEAIGNNRFSAYIKSHKSMLTLEKTKQKISDTGHYDSISFRQYTANKQKSEFENNEWAKMTTTTSLTKELKKESEDMEEILRSVEKYYRGNSVLQIDNAFKFSKAVAELAVEFEGYMTANNRGAFKDVESLTNHTDKVIRAMSKLTTAYIQFFREFQKYFQNSGGGDELSLSVAVSKLAEFTGEI